MAALVPPTLLMPHQMTRDQSQRLAHDDTTLLGNSKIVLGKLAHERIFTLSLAISQQSHDIGACTRGRLFTRFIR